ncbi:hypothetical protein FSP39_011308 [Pinctada imbricata]|uniref:G-protein coupled receptors family 1 profile domain-containing protein n=1 Tax=Pinctada imbricata TaxID=66713 RepID=A0AA89BZ74_PINIB|nr:hypothetical protein FSP39_011308 [Pinctada imbricata]
MASKYYPEVPIGGVEEGLFYVIHGLALTCITASLTCAVIVLVLSFKRGNYKTFFTKWSRCDRFIVYLAICDGMFNFSHLMDHIHMIITEEHVWPAELCSFYAFMLFEFVSAQCILVVVIAVNAFALIRFRKSLPLGKRDWILLTLTFGVAFVLCVIAAGLGQMGPTGTYCGIYNKIASIFFTVIPQVSVLVSNSVLYFLTWYHIRKETKRVQDSLGNKVKDSKAQEAGKTMTLFVAVFFIQYWGVTIAGFWNLFADVPIALDMAVVSFANLGGVLNGIVFIIINRSKKKKQTTKRKEISTVETNES